MQSKSKNNPKPKAVELCSFDSFGLLAAARASGLVLIPCRASTADLHAIAASVDLVRIELNPPTARLRQRSIRSLRLTC